MIPIQVLNKTLTAVYGAQAPKRLLPVPGVFAFLHTQACQAQALEEELERSLENHFALENARYAAG